MVEFNITLLIQLGNFLVTLVVLNYLLIHPVREIVRKRRDFASSILADTEEFSRDAAAKLKNYEASLAKAREEAAALRDAKRFEGATKEAKLLSDAMHEAQAFLLSSRENTRKSAAEATVALEKRVPDLAKMAASRLLGKTKHSSAA
ncbi:ATP synthase F0 subunit B' [Deltaproteobacteria bacterium]|nr:ATP synthase F0 subunit B' [Deltaproteobacteria bacterium]